jgi:peptidylamidoglycolate lyase
MNRRCLLTLLAVLCFSGAVAAQEKGGEEETGPYEVVPNWPQPLHSDFTSGSTIGVWAVSSDRIFVFQRGELPVSKDPLAAGYIPARGAATAATNPRWEHILCVYDANGKLVESWEQHNGLFVRPHRIVMNPYDRERHIWLIDDGGHQVFKFTHDGKKLLMTLGEKNKPGNDKTHFNRPTDIAFLPNGDFYVSDGYVNTRVVKFSSDGNYLFEWGKPGAGPGEFNLVHAITIDSQNRIYVADRTNSRVQIFDLNGKYLSEWKNIRSPFYLYLSGDNHLWVADGMTNKFLKYDLNGNLLYSWGTFGAFPGGLWGPHQFTVDSQGNLYIAETFGGRVQKFRPKPGADPSRLITLRPPAFSN